MERLFLGIHINYSLSCSHFLLLSCNLSNFPLVLERRQWLWWGVGVGGNDLFITLWSFQLHCLYNKLWRINFLFRPLDPDIRSQTFGTKIIFCLSKVQFIQIKIFWLSISSFLLWILRDCFGTHVLAEAERVMGTKKSSGEGCWGEAFVNTSESHLQHWVLDLAPRLLSPSR